MSVPEPLRTELVHGLAGFERLAPGWDDLVRAMARPSPPAAVRSPYPTVVSVTKLK